MACKMKCENNPDFIPSQTNAWQSGYKYCGECCKFVKVDSIWCPCCGWHLRLSPRLAKSKRRFWKENV